jgi:hypothetical protein
MDAAAFNWTLNCEWTVLMFRNSVVQEFEHLVHVGITESNPGEVESGTFTDTVDFAQPWRRANARRAARVEGAAGEDRGC